MKNNLRLLESSSFGLKHFMLEYRTIDAVREKLRELSEKNGFSSGFEKKSFNTKRIFHAQCTSETQKMV